MQNMVDLVAAAIFPVLISIPHTTLLYLFSSSAFMKITHEVGRVLQHASPKELSKQSISSHPAGQSGRSEEAGRHVRPAMVSVKTMPHYTKVSGPVDVNRLLDRAIVDYVRQNRGMLPSLCAAFITILSLSSFFLQPQH